MPVPEMPYWLSTAMTSQCSAGVERQDVGAVDGQAVVVDVHDMDVLGEVGEVDRALPGAAHQVEALTGASRGRRRWPVRLVLAVELDQPLVGDHRALAGEDVVVAARATTRSSCGFCRV